jgi:hypothetical protein
MEVTYRKKPALSKQNSGKTRSTGGMRQGMSRVVRVRMEKNGSFVKKLKRKNIITDAEALRKDYPQISPMTKIKSLKTKLKNGFLKICEICVICG